MTSNSSHGLQCIMPGTLLGIISGDRSLLSLPGEWKKLAVWKWSEICVQPDSSDHGTSAPAHSSEGFNPYHSVILWSVLGLVFQCPNSSFTHAVTCGSCKGPLHRSWGRKDETWFTAADNLCIRHSEVRKIVTSVVWFVFLVEPQPVRIVQKIHSLSLLRKGLWWAGYWTNASLTQDGTAQSRATDARVGLGSD